MNALRLALAGLLALGLVATAAAEEKKDDNKAKLVGDWVVVKSYEGGPPADSVISFGKDGKMKVTHKQDGKDVTMDGTYVLDGDTFMLTLKAGDQERKHKIIIKKLTADELSTVNEAGKAVEMKKKK